MFIQRQSIAVFCPVQPNVRVSHSASSDVAQLQTRRASKQFAVLGRAEIRVSPQKKLTLSHPATTHLVFSV